MKSNASRLDVDELLHLAIRASQQNLHEETIDYLKKALEIEPNNGKVYYLLGAQHAELGLYDRAAEEMAKAVKLDPSLVTAHFQLGLLHITSGRVQEAIDAWKPLDALGEKNFLYLFKSGMLHLVRDEFQQCIDNLTKGIALNTFNEALNNDMQRIIDEVKQRMNSAPTDPKAGSKPDKAKESRAGHVLLSAYRDNKSEKE